MLEMKVMGVVVVVVVMGSDGHDGSGNMETHQLIYRTQKRTEY